ncbi:MAG: hypothetical protein R6V01_00770 [Thermoplasmatota archaeon]
MMRKGPIFLGIGVALVLISIPTAFAYTLYESKEVPKYEFVQSSDNENEFYYEFGDLGPGTLTIKGSVMILETDVLHITLRDSRGRTVRKAEMGISGIFGSSATIEVDSGGTYTLYISIENDPEITDFKVTYTGEHSNFGLMTFIIGFPLFLLSGAISLIVGIVLTVRFKRTGSEISPHKEIEDLHYDNLEEYYEEIERPLNRESEKIRHGHVEDKVEEKKTDKERAKSKRTPSGKKKTPSGMKREGSKGGKKD